MKHKNLQPWLDYFQMLRRYEEKGFLELHPDKREAYITRAALLTLAQPSTPKLATQGLFQYLMYRCAHIEGVKYYDAAMLAAPEGPASDKPSWQTEKLMAHASAVVKELEAGTFALHVVKEDPPHDLLSTIVLTPKKHWWQRDKIEVIDYKQTRPDGKAAGHTTR